MSALRQLRGLRRRVWAAYDERDALRGTLFLTEVALYHARGFLPYVGVIPWALPGPETRVVLWVTPEQAQRGMTAGHYRLATLMSRNLSLAAARDIEAGHRPRPFNDMELPGPGRTYCVTAAVR